MMELPEKFYDGFSRLDTIPVCDGLIVLLIALFSRFGYYFSKHLHTFILTYWRTDRQTDTAQWQRPRYASRG